MPPRKPLKKCPPPAVPAAVSPSQPSLLDLPGASAPAAFTLSASETSERLAPFTGMNDAALRNLEAKRDPSGAPYIPKAVRGKRDTAATLAGVNRYLRDRAEKSEGLRTNLPNMEALEALTGIPRSHLKTMKSDGAPGFHDSGRINLPEWLAGLGAWLAGKTDKDRFVLQREGVGSYAEMKEKYQALNEQIKNGELSGATINKQTALAVALEVLSIHCQSYDRILQETPVLLAGQNAATVRAEMEKYLKTARDAEESALAKLRTEVTEAHAKELTKEAA